MDLQPADVLLEILRLLHPRNLAVCRSVCPRWRAVIDDHRLLHMDALPAILRRLPPRTLALCRSVCTGWRAVVDDRRLLRTDLLPLSLGGLIFEKRRLRGDPDAGKEPLLMDCCNGLLLLQNSVVNPATRQRVLLPPQPPPCSAAACQSCGGGDRHLLFDPTVSPHYEVFSVPHIPGDLPSWHISKHTHSHESVTEMEWPPSPYVMHVFSSKTMCWEERSFVREVDAIGMVAAVKPPCGWNVLHQAACWREALYVLCEHYFVLRINSSEDTYRVIKLPTGSNGQYKVRLGKSREGVYCVLHSGRYTFQVWFLNEWRGQMHWVMKHNMVNLYYDVRNYLTCHADNESCILRSHGQMEWLLKYGISLILVGDTEALAEDDFEWDCDNENVAGIARPHGVGHDTLYFECLGFHPYKEIALFHVANTIMAYYLNSSKVRCLGKMKNRYNEIDAFFPYSPYWERELPGSK